MGTRNLICVIADGDFRVAQYGQWDGYPEGQGAGVLDFLKTHDLTVFKNKVLACHWLSEDETKAIDAVAGWPKKYPHLSRDAGSDVLDMINDAPDGGLGLVDTRGFAGDSLFCEWAYVIDLDLGVLEVYKGFNKTPTPADSRFPSGADWLEGHPSHRAPEDRYEPVVLVKSYPLDALPNKEDFVKEVMAAAGYNEEEDA